MMCSPELNSSEGGNGCIEVATPPQFPKGIPGIWSLEHLFTTAVSSLMTTFLAIAENSKIKFTAFSCKSKGKLEQPEGKFLMTEVILEPHVTIVHEKDRERAELILQRAEAACLISKQRIQSFTLLSSLLKRSATNFPPIQRHAIYCGYTRCDCLHKR